MLGKRKGAAWGVVHMGCAVARGKSDLAVPRGSGFLFPLATTGRLDVHDSKEFATALSKPALEQGRVSRAEKWKTLSARS